MTNGALPLSMRAIRRRILSMWPLDKIVADLTAGGADPASVANAVRTALENPPVVGVP